MGVEIYKPGDTVRHMNGARGRVVAIVDTRFGTRGVEVEFDPAPGRREPRKKWRGTYDNTWLKMYPDGLQLIDE